MPSPVVASFFSGIGGFELAFGPAGFEVGLLCEVDKSAQRVLRSKFPGVRLSPDITKLQNLPPCDVLVAGWPCQDLSQAGKMAGIDGSQSGLIKDVFRLLDTRSRKPPVILFENVAFALSLSGGSAIRYVTEQLENRGYRWAYRVLDTQNFGLPQRRRRIYIVAALDASPEGILFDGLHASPVAVENATQYGFYWTEGNRGVGWTPNAIPPLKGGSAFSIPSPPAIWLTATGKFVTPSIVDAERFQGFPENWTSDADDDGVSRVRWRQVGNAVSVPVARWVADRIAKRHQLKEFVDERSTEIRAVHNAAWGGPGIATRYVVRGHEGPTKSKRRPLDEFGLVDAKPLSLRAAKGFFGRYSRSGLTKNDAFVEALSLYCGLADSRLSDGV